MWLEGSRAGGQAPEEKGWAEGPVLSAASHASLSVTQSDFPSEKLPGDAVGRTERRGGVGREEKNHRELVTTHAGDDRGPHQRRS